MDTAVGQVGKRQSPAFHFSAIFNSVETACHSLDRHLDMPGPKIDAMIKAASRNERNGLAKMLDRLCENLLAFHDVLVK